MACAAIACAVPMAYTGDAIMIHGPRCGHLLTARSSFPVFFYFNFDLPSRDRNGVFRRRENTGLGGSLLEQEY
jgi:hypothetical protein